MAIRRGPSDREIERYKQRGLTYQQMSDEWYKVTGERVSWRSIASNAQRAGLATPRASYREVIPWSPMPEHHQNTTPVRRLRALGKRLQGKKLTQDEERRLERWLKKMEAKPAVVAYLPDTKPGHWYIKVDKYPEDGIPVLEKPLIYKP